MVTGDPAMIMGSSSSKSSSRSSSPSSLPSPTCDISTETSRIELRTQLFALFALGVRFPTWAVASVAVVFDVPRLRTSSSVVMAGGIDSSRDTSMPDADSDISCETNVTSASVLSAPVVAVADDEVLR